MADYMPLASFVIDGEVMGIANLDLFGAMRTQSRNSWVAAIFRMDHALTGLIYLMRRNERAIIGKLSESSL